VLRAATVAERQVERLVRIVDDLLDVSRVSRGRIDIRPEPVDVAGAIERALESARPLLAARRHTVAWQTPDPPLSVLADPLRFEQMLVNLLTNAAKYSEPDGRVEITAIADEGQVEIGVRDRGVGLEPEELEAIFELFVQIDDSLSRSEGGLGIGLPLVRQLAKLHGGTVHATSPGRGQGSVFVLRLPRSLVPGRGQAAPAPVSHAAPPRRRILLVDDNQDAVELMSDVLRARGHHVEVAHDADEALALAGRESFEIAFLDIGLPGVSGYALAPRLRQALAPRPCVLVAVTGYGQPEDVSAARAAGFDHHFVKPVSLAQLEALINSQTPG
jgi:CheY-like chemotaxis protein/anti-sigma regulatory factor (Ser/Thr protein kinase)